MALLVLSDLARRAKDLVAHYSDQGVLPRSELDLGPYSFSLNTLSGAPEFQALLFGLAALGALSMLVGYRTRLATFVVWLLVLSIQLRNPLVLTGGDQLLHLLLFWGIFLPLGTVWSVDRARADERGGAIDALLLGRYGCLVFADSPHVLGDRDKQVRRGVVER